MANTVFITGNTFPVKDQIKAMGARWDADAKGWRVPADKAADAQALVSGAPRQAFSGPRKCRACGMKEGTKMHCAPPLKLRRDGLCWDCASDN